MDRLRGRDATRWVIGSTNRWVLLQVANVLPSAQMTMFSHSVSIFTSSLISALSTLIDKPSDRRLVLSLSRPHFQALFPPQLTTSELILGRDLTQPWFSITESPSALQSFPCSEVRLDLSQKSQSWSTKISGDRNRKWGQLFNYFTSITLPTAKGSARSWDKRQVSNLGLPKVSPIRKVARRWFGCKHVEHCLKSWQPAIQWNIVEQ